MARSEIPVAELEDFAIELAHTAGGIAKAHFRKSFSIENKASGGFDPVTSADRAIEQVLRAAIMEKYPDHGIIGEEESDRGARSSYCWYLDPIDGTRAFMTGSPLWGTLVGLTLKDVPMFGLLCQPVLEEVFLGSTGGSWLIKPDRRERLRTRACTQLDAAVLTSTHPGLFEGASAKAFDALSRKCLMTRYGGDCYNYAMLAAGFVDVVVESQLKPFDIVPLIPVLEGAGAVVTDWDGRPPLAGGSVAAAATPELHRAVLDVLNG
jgi:histidinol phosphatase-like enzyme (inositol monophosphatase family)